MSELSYKELQEQGVFDVPYRAFKYMQSQQAKIDELQKRIDEISNHVEINYDENRDDDIHSYWSGYNQALRELSEILKGEETKWKSQKFFQRIINELI